GGYTSHLGGGVMFLGVAGNSFKIGEEATRKTGGKASSGRYDTRLDKLDFAHDGQQTRGPPDPPILKPGSAEEIGTLAPGKWTYRKAEEQTTTEVDKRMTIREDLYTVLAGYDAEKGIAVLQFKINPLVNFVWMGCSFLMFGFCIAVWPEPNKVRS